MYIIHTKYYNAKFSIEDDSKSETMKFLFEMHLESWKIEKKIPEHLTKRFREVCNKVISNLDQ